MSTQATRPGFDVTMRWRCQVHGDAPATYLGRERYGCWHCAIEAYDKAEAAAAAAAQPICCANCTAEVEPHPQTGVWIVPADALPANCPVTGSRHIVR